MIKKVGVDNIIIKDIIVTILNINIPRNLLIKECLEMPRADFIKAYNLSSRGYDYLYKTLQISKFKKSKVDIFLESLDVDKFAAEYKIYSKKELATKYNCSEVMISKLIKRLNLHLSKEIILNKVKNTSIKKFGVEHYSKTSEFKTGIKSTKLKRYGDQNYNNKEQAIETCLEKYGATNPNKTDAVKEKIKETVYNKYGETHYYKTADFKNKAQQTKAQKYGDKNFTNRAMAKQTCMERYGTEFPNQSDKVKNKRKKTTQDKYGVNNVFQSEEIKKKIIKTCQERYGVDYPCMTSQCRDASVGNDSRANLVFKALLDAYNIPYDREFPIEKFQYDFKVGTILIEINPTATHNSSWGWRGNKDSGLNQNYHLLKSQVAHENGYRCIHVFDWDDINKVIKLLLPREKIYAKNCKVGEVTAEEAKKFININHIQNWVKDKVRVGLYYNDSLVSIMTFGNPRYNKKYDWELLRYCSSANVVGGAKKLFHYFLNNYQGSIISYCDTSKFTGDIYKILGFIKINSVVDPSKHWSHPYTNKHITDNLLRQFGYDGIFHTSYGKGTSNEELMLKAGFVEVYDCGQDTYVYTCINWERNEVTNYASDV